jgi:MAF protein
MAYWPSSASSDIGGSRDASNGDIYATAMACMALEAGYTDYWLAVPGSPTIAKASYGYNNQIVGGATVAADTIVVVDGDILGKPRDRAEAAAMLRRLGGREHVVHTAIAVAFGGRMASGVEATRVWFRTLDEPTIEAYIATGEPLDKAGAYGIQGFGAVLVERIEGDYFTVMGLGLARLVDLLGEAGLRYAFGVITPAA